ncbi:hypothetical protein BGZ63DRAFT_383013 [Mariannaea sp. PMI_226]|nr:hypothetical protein BGZ63DRAFT_383013 [Mariannaea sp. PMI_226]
MAMGYRLLCYLSPRSAFPLWSAPVLSVLEFTAHRPELLPLTTLPRPLPVPVPSLLMLAPSLSPTPFLTARVALP